MSADSIESKPLFIVGMNGSGTTMLLDCLGRHPELYAFPRETRVIPYYLNNQHKFGDLKSDENFRKLWDEIRNLTVFRFANDQQPVPIPNDWASHPRDAANVLDAVFSYFAASESKTRWCEKTPQNVQHIETIAKRFPGATFVHVVRDGRDSAASFNRRWRRTPELTIYRWKKVLREGRRQGSSLGSQSYMEVRYEDLTAEPEVWLRKICDFLAIAFDAAVLESSRPYLDAGQLAGKSANNGTLTPNSGKWRQHFSPRKIARLERISGSALREFGYETEQPDSDVDVSTLRRKWWSVKDAIVQYGREIYLKFTGQIERPWSFILAKPMIAFKQRRENPF